MNPQPIVPDADIGPCPVPDELLDTLRQEPSHPPLPDSALLTFEAIRDPSRVRRAALVEPVVSPNCMNWGWRLAAQMADIKGQGSADPAFDLFDGLEAVWANRVDRQAGDA